MPELTFMLTLVYAAILLIVIALQKKCLGVAFFAPWPEEKDGFSTQRHFLHVVVANLIAASLTLLISRFM